ncbi:MAG: AMP-binding protein [Acidimicrobiales bacterium]
MVPVELPVPATQSGAMDTTPTGLLFEVFRSAAAGSATVRFLPGEARVWTAREIDSLSRVSAAWLRRRIGAGNSVAAVLTSSVDCIALVVGALRAGVRLVSLPYPSRDGTAAGYLAQVERMCSLTEATALLVDPIYKPLTGPLSVPVYGFDECCRGIAGHNDDVPGTLVQFSSGSTRFPKGIELPLAAIEANVVAMMDIYRPGGREVVCSWLPLSHDMGLIGMLLTPLAALHPRWSSTGHLVLIDPLHFLKNPAVWLQTCSEYGVSFTAAPPSALDLAARALRTGRTLDLTSLRALVVGSEPVRADVLRRFARSAEVVGMSPKALCPGYGLGEATLGVSAVRCDEDWTAASVDREQLGDGRWVERGNGQEIVSCGRPLPGVEVRVGGGEEVGNLELKSPGLLRRYVGDDSVSMTPDGWFRTSDAGHVGADRQVYVVGRTDDVCFVGGRNIYLHDLDPVVEVHPLVRSGGGVAIAGATGSVVIVAECRRPSISTDQMLAACREIRAEVVRQCTVRASAVALTRPGTVPKTPSGKIRRNELAERYRVGDVAVLVSV